MKRFFLGSAICIISLIFIGGGVLFVWIGNLKLPNLDSFDERKVSESTKIYDRTGEVLLYDVHKNIQRTLIPPQDISRHMKNAIVAIEDEQFYQHTGIDVLSTLRAVGITTLSKLGLREGGIQGGSTITQQVVKNTLLTSDQKIARKLKEWFLAVKLDQQKTKDEILAHYLNVVPFGGSMYGIEEASNSFFGKPASKLNITESAYLAALPNAPTYFSPYGPNRDKLEERKNYILRKMYDLGFITTSEYKEAREKEVTFNTRTEDSNKSAMHFIQYIRRYLEKNYGNDVIQNEGLKVTTTIDLELQKYAEGVVTKNAKKNEEKWNAENQGVVVIDPKTGQIRTMVGSRNYFSDKIDGSVNITTAKRQPGSAFKPFVYLTAFMEGYPDTTTVFDARTQFTQSCAPDNLTSKNDCYSPRNYDNKELGPVTLREGLAQSRNIASVKLLHLVDPKDAIQTARNLGITTLERSPSRYGLTLVLGGGEVTLLDMTGAYATLANGGVRNRPTGILKIENKKGKILEEYKKQPERAAQKNAVAWLNDILDDDEARVGLFSSRNNFMFFDDRPVAAKTGTTNKNRDAWLLGYTPQVAVGVWTGNNDNTPMERGSAISGDTWRTVMEKALEDKSIEQFNTPKRSDEYEELPPILRGKWRGGKSVTIDTVSGKFATKYTPKQTKKKIILPNPHSILHWIDPNNPRGSQPKKSERDSQYKNWEYSVDRWLKNNPSKATENATFSLPEEKDDIHIPENRPDVNIMSPATDATIVNNESIEITVDITGKFPPKEVRYFINGIFVGSRDSQPFTYSFTPSELNQTKQKNIIKAVVYDSVYNQGIATQSFSMAN